MAVTLLGNGWNGQAHGTAVINDAASGFDTYLVDGTGVTFTFTTDVDDVWTGTSAIKSSGVATTAHAYGYKLGFDTPQLGLDIMYKIGQVLSAELPFLRWADGSNIVLARLFLTSLEKFRLTDAAGATKFDGALAVPIDTWLRVKTWWSKGSSTTTGSFSLRIWNAETDTLLDSYDTTVSNFGVNNLGRFQLGLTANSPGDVHYDLCGYDPAATGLLADLDITPSIPAGWSEYRFFTPS